MVKFRLIIGASYIALETAGFLSGLGIDCTIMSRANYLRGFDQQMTIKLIQNMKNQSNLKFLEKSQPTNISKTPLGKLKISWKSQNDGESVESVHEEEFDTIMMAIGRTPETQSLNLENANVQVLSNGKIPVQNERTNVPHIYALGDVIEQLELTPTAIKAGKLLSRRLYGGGKELMNYDLVPTTVFTPLEYSCCGLTEEKAIQQFGRENIRIYHVQFKPLKWILTDKDNDAYIKVICNINDNERILGIHILSPNSGEILQGYAVAMKMGATKADLDSTVGIHPTVSEELVTMTITKESGEDPQKTAC